MKWFFCVVSIALAILLLSNAADLTLTVLRYKHTILFEDKFQKMEDRLNILFNKIEDKFLKMEDHLNAMHAALTSRANCISSEDIKGLLRNLLVPYR